MSDLKIVIFSIGNPGQLHRHSVGHWVLNELVDFFEVEQLQRKGKFSKSTTHDGQFTLVKSNTYMNDSNLAFKPVSKSLSADTLVLVIYDDFDSNLGKVRLSRFKKNESHNGLKSIQKCFASADSENVYKLGIGIGPKPSNASKDTMGSWVLSKLTQPELEVLENITLDKVTAYLGEIVRQGEVGDCGKLNSRMTNRIDKS